MSKTTLEDKLDLVSDLVGDEDYDPLEFIEGEDDEDWMDDDSLLLPSPLPPQTIEAARQPAVFSPERAGSVAQAVRELVETNAGRRTILLSVIDWAREGISASELFERINEAEVDNLSVYEPVSYCRMLERAGALTLKLAETAPAETSEKVLESVPEAAPEDTPEAAPQSATSEENEETLSEQVEFLTIEDEIDPEWQATEEGLSAYEELIQGNEWREKLFGPDSRYAEVYLVVMDALAEGSKPKKEIIDEIETFEVTKEPKKFGAYFFDVLEATSAIQWSNEKWVLTSLGQELHPELKEFCEKKQQLM